MSEAQTYDFHLIFKGLFRCVPDRVNKRLTILLADARSPKNNSRGEPLRDHRAVVEFFLKDWRNPTSEPLPKLVEVNKRNKGEVGIYMLNRQDIRIGAVNGDLSPGLTFIEDDSPNSFLKLPQMETISQGSGSVAQPVLDSGDGCVARVLDLDRGIVRSERLSTFRGHPLRWAYSLPRERARIEAFRDPQNADPDKLLLQQDLQQAVEVNLDLRVTAQVPKGTCVVIDPNPFPNDGFATDPPAFMLRPQEEGTALEVWIKNRELDVILTESDKEGVEEGCLDAEFVDFDFELLYALSANQNLARRIPYRDDSLSNGPVTAGGCACGGCSGG